MSANPSTTTPRASLRRKSPLQKSITGREFTARHRFARITARKARYVADMIRGRSVNQALELLQFAPQRGASFYLKVVRSAVANASHDESVNINRLFISECKADDGPLLNNRMRFRPGPQGRAMPFAKRLSHLTIKVAEVREPEAAARPTSSTVEGAATPSAGGSADEAAVKPAGTSLRKKAPKSKKSAQSPKSQETTKSKTRKVDPGTSGDKTGKKKGFQA